MFDKVNPLGDPAQLAQQLAPRHVRTHWLLDAAIGAILSYLIYRNWWRGWVRCPVTELVTYVGTSIVTALGAMIASAYIKPGDQNDLGPILILTALFSLAVAIGGRKARERHEHTV